MNAVADKSEPLTAIHTDLGAIFVSLELSRSIWLITSLSPGGREKMSKHSVPGGDFAGLMERFAQLQERHPPVTCKSLSLGDRGRRREPL
jgi:transposase